MKIPKGELKLKVFKEFLKMRWKYVGTALIALFIGAAIGPSQEQVDTANAKVDKYKTQLAAKSETIDSLKSKNKDLQAKVDEAAPWFKEQEDQKQKEAEAKAAEEKRIAEEKAKQEAAAAAKAKEEVETVIEEPAEGQKVTVDNAKELIEYYAIGENDKLTNFTFKNGEIKATIDLAPVGQFSDEDIAVNIYSQLSDELLNRDGWQILTVTFANIGTVSMNRNEKETNEYGDYFPTLEIEDRLLGS